MSHEHAKSFLDALDEDPELYQKVADVQNQTIELAKSHGYHFSKEEIRKAMSDRMGVELPKQEDDGADPSTCAMFSEAPGR